MKLPKRKLFFSWGGNLANWLSSTYFIVMLQPLIIILILRFFQNVDLRFYSNRHPCFKIIVSVSISIFSNTNKCLKTINLIKIVHSCSYSWWCYGQFSYKFRSQGLDYETDASLSSSTNYRLSMNLPVLLLHPVAVFYFIILFPFC